MSRIAFGVIGSGWRTEFYLRVAAALPDRFEVIGVAGRRSDRLAELHDRFGVRTFTEPGPLLDQCSKAFIVVSVPRTVAPAMIRIAAAADVPVLTETPPAGSLDELISLWELTRDGARIQCAEQYPFQPLHAARLAFVAGGRIGRPTYAHVSVAHGYHGIALIRRFLDVGLTCPTLTARRFTAPLVAGPTRAGPPAAESITDATHDLVHFDFGDKLALFDFSGAQYFSYIRRQHLLVRGERGELANCDATYLADHCTPVHVHFERHEAGPNGNLEGLYLKGIQAGERWLYENPLAPARLTDDEIAVGTCLLHMSTYLQTGTSPYTFADACHDAYLDQLMQQALTTGQPVVAQRQPWCGTVT